MERSTILVAPRYYTDLETSKLTSEDYEQSDGKFRPCFGCHTLIPAYFNKTLVCRSCKFPIHNVGCEVSPWHIAECKIFKTQRIQNWYDEVGRRQDIMIHIAVLRGVLLKQTNNRVWTQIMSMESDSPYFISEKLRLSILYFIFDLCKVEGVEIEEVVKLLKIFMKQRLNCTLPCSINKRCVNVADELGAYIVTRSTETSLRISDWLAFYVRVSFHLRWLVTKMPTFKDVSTIIGCGWFFVL